MTIDQDTIAGLLQLGGQYLLPIAALLRALYSGARGRFPEGFAQIAVASLFAGFAAATDTGQPYFDIRAIGIAILSNSTFVAGLLSFIMLYLLRQPDRGQIVDGVVGGFLGAISWLIWVGVLGNNLPWWTAPLAIIAGVAGFIALRFALRQIIKLVTIATYFIIAGGLVVIAAIGIWFIQLITGQLAA